jgi:hypothetical protein
VTPLGKRWNVTRVASHALTIAALTYGEALTSTRATQYSSSAAEACVATIVRDDLPGWAVLSVQREASRIWLRHRISVKWRQLGDIDPDRSRSSDCVLLVFDDYQLRQFGPGKDRAFGRTVFHGRQRTIYVSATRALEMTHALFNPSDQGVKDQSAVRLLARIVAHELGHVFLDTQGHSQVGLMKPIFGVQDVRSLDDRETALSVTETRRLTTRFSLVPDDALTTTARRPPPPTMINR